MGIAEIKKEVLALLQQLIRIPSFSREEDKTGDYLEQWLKDKDVTVHRYKNNLWAYNKHFAAHKPTLLLNSHHDTVKPAKAYTNDPFSPIVENSKLYGLGSNDAGGPLVSLIGTFLHFYNEDIPYNLIIAATAEEEITGKDGIECILDKIGVIDCAIVGEPTRMQMAVAERGLMVLDCTAVGKAGHAARDEGDNALYKALQDIGWIKNYNFEKVSDFLGPVKLTVTVIETENKAHNVVPATCNFVVDVRVNECYSFEDIVGILSGNLQSEIRPRSMRLRSSIIPVQHSLVQSGIALGRNYYGSPTTSDKALMPFNALKMGPGDSARSHTADEYILISEIEEGIDLYIQLLNHFFNFSSNAGNNT